MLDVITIYGLDFEIKFNPNKTVYTVFNNNKSNQTIFDKETDSKVYT
jgi:hypothetical protein